MYIDFVEWNIYVLHICPIAGALHESILSSASAIERRGMEKESLEIPSYGVCRARPSVVPSIHPSTGATAPFFTSIHERAPPSSIDFVDGIKRRFVSLSRNGDNGDEFACQPRKLARPWFFRDSGATVTLGIGALFTFLRLGMGK